LLYHYNNDLKTQVSGGNMTVLLHAALFLELIGGAAIFAAARGSGRQAGNFAIDPLGLKKVHSDA
jgi:hypothetical protein